MHRKGTSTAKLLAVIGSLTALLVAVPLAQSSTKNIDTFSLVASQRGWDSLRAESACTGGVTGYTPVEDGASLAGHTLRDDGFDGGLLLGVNAAGFDDLDGKGQFHRRTNTLNVGPTPTGGLRVSRAETAHGPYLRSLIKLKNPTGSGFTGLISWESNLGSDGNETTQASSSGDKTFTTADRWVVSAQSPPLTNTIDPVLVFALFGKGASEKVDSVVMGPGTGCLWVDYQNVHVPANGTRYLLFYTEMDPVIPGAKKSAKKYNRHRLSRALLKGISSGVRHKILNWDL